MWGRIADVAESTVPATLGEYINSLPQAHLRGRKAIAPDIARWFLRQRLLGYWIAGPRYIEPVVSPRRVKPGAKSIRS